jgi:uncharacterized protein
MLRPIAFLSTAAFLIAAGMGFAADFSPSFDCAKAATPDERLICASNSLSLGDQAVAGAFQAARDVLPEPERKKLIAEQRLWVDARNRQCGIDRETILQPRIFFTAIPCMQKAMQARQKVLEERRAAAMTKIAAKSVNETGAYAQDAFNAPPEALSNDVLIALVPQIPDTDAVRALSSPRAAASDALFKAILDRFGPQWKADAANRAAFFKLYVCRIDVWDALDADHLSLEPKERADLFLATAQCPSLAPLERLTRRTDWIGTLTDAERDAIVTRLRLDPETFKPIARRDPGQLALERTLIGDPKFTAKDWTAGEAVVIGVQNPQKALNALERFDSGRNLVWRAIYTRLATSSPEESKAKIAPLIREAGHRLYKADAIYPGFNDDFADRYEGTLEELVDWIAWMSSWTETPLEDPQVSLLPCDLLIAHPAFIGAQTPQHGGQRDGSLPNFNCDGVAPMPKPVSAYLDAADNLYLGDRYQGGEGSIRYSYMVEQSQALLRMRLLPGSYLNDPKSGPVDLTDIPLARWSIRSLWNHTEFETRAKPLFLKARAALAAHYRRATNMNEQDALNAAHLALWDYMEPTRRKEALGEPESPLNLLILNSRPAAAIAAATDTTQWNDTGFWKGTAMQDPPLQNAVTRPEVVKVLLEHKADPNIANGLGRTPLMTAALYDNLESVNLLLAAGADINRQSKKAEAFPDVNQLYGALMHGLYYGRRSALMYAAANSKLPLIKVLLEHGADKTLKDDWGLTAQDYLLGRGPVPANPKLSAAERKEAAGLLAPN